MKNFLAITGTVVLGVIAGGLVAGWLTDWGNNYSDLHVFIIAAAFETVGVCVTVSTKHAIERMLYRRYTKRMKAEFGRASRGPHFYGPSATKVSR